MARQNQIDPQPHQTLLQYEAGLKKQTLHPSLFARCPPSLQEKSIRRMQSAGRLDKRLKFNPN